MSITIETGVSALTVFMQGVLSFFSPCVFPLIPLYIGYLAGGTVKTDSKGNQIYSRKTIMVHTLCFLVGVSFAFFLLGLGVTAIGKFFAAHKIWFVRTGGLIMILFGLYQMDVLGKTSLLEKERRFPFRMKTGSMNPVAALVFGFTFSFAWTPCIGPVLTSVLLMASSARTSEIGFALIGIYALGFSLPFLLVGAFTGTVLEIFRKYIGVMRYTVKAGGILLVVMGAMTIAGWANGISGYLSDLSGSDDTEAVGENAEVKEEEESSDEFQRPSAPDFTLTDQNGEVHTLSEYKGKTVLLNFWATWCGPCKQEMPDIQKLYEEYGENEGEVVILGVANPKTSERPQNSDVSGEDIADFLNRNGYTYPVVMDTEGETLSEYGISAFPTTYMIDSEGRIYGYVTGTLTEEMMVEIINQTMEENPE